MAEPAEHAETDDSMNDLSLKSFKDLSIGEENKYLNSADMAEVEALIKNGELGFYDGTSNMNGVTGNELSGHMADKNEAVNSVKQESVHSPPACAKQRNDRHRSSGHKKGEPRMEVILKNRMVRLRYESELGNRNIGKEELVSIKFHNMETISSSDIWVRVHAVHKDNKKAHPYCLIGERCKNGVYCDNFKPSAENDSTCIVKATVKIPKRGEYEEELKRRKQEMEKTLGLHIAECKKADYWMANKGIKECQSLRLCVEAYYMKDKTTFLLNEITDPMSNAKDGKTFKIHTIRPCSAPCSGVPIHCLNDYMLIVLSVDSFEPKKHVEVLFKDNEGWQQMARNVTIIKNVIECEIPPYKSCNLESPVNVKVVLRDPSKDMQTAGADFQFYPTDVMVMDNKKRKVEYSNIPNHVKDEAEKCKKESADKLHKKVTKRTKGRVSSASKTQACQESSPVPSPFGGNLNTNVSTAGDFNFSADPNLYQSKIEGNDPMFSSPDFLDDKFTPGLGDIGDLVNASAFSTPMMTTAAPMPPHSAQLPVSSLSQVCGQNPFTNVPTQSNFTTAMSPPQPAYPQVQSPTANRGKFKTVTDPITGKTFILDQNNKVLLIMGGDSAVEVNDIPEISLPSAPMSFNPGSPMSPQQQQQMQLQLQPQMQPQPGLQFAATSNTQFMQTQQQIDLSTTGLAPHQQQQQYGSQPVYQQTFTSQQLMQSQYGIDRLHSRDLATDGDGVSQTEETVVHGADILGLAEVTVTTTDKTPESLGDVILVGDEEPGNTGTFEAESSTSGSYQSDQKASESGQGSDQSSSGEQEDLDNVMNSLSSMEIKDRASGPDTKRAGDLDTDNVMNSLSSMEQKERESGAKQKDSGDR